MSGNFTLTSTGTSARLRLASGTTNILGNYTQTGGYLWLGSDPAGILNVGGNFSLTGGTFLVTDNLVSTLNVAGNFISYCW